MATVCGRCRDRTTPGWPGSTYPRQKGSAPAAVGVLSSIADRERLGVGGWSYGAILTNYVIARDHRFKVAISGAGSSLQLSMYGSDQYTRQYDLEMGPPWKNRDRWLRVSYPFFEADRITTPTLFMGGDADPKPARRPAVDPPVR